MAKKFENLQAPSALRELKGWLVWRWVQRPGRPKALKMPYYLSGSVRNKTHGSADDRRLLVTFEEARAFAQKHDFAGVGLALMPEFGITALDFDNCVKDGVIDPRVEKLTAGTYAELSPSGTGVRAFMLGESPDSKDSTPVDGSFGFETFHAKGFVTFTGHVTELTELTGSENTVAPLSEEVKAFCATRFKRIDRVRAECVGAGKPTMGFSPEQIGDLLKKLPDQLCYDDWVAVGMAVHHETEGEGFDVWDEWSSLSPKYTNSEYSMERWRSFGQNQTADYKTMGTVLQMIRDSGGETGFEVAAADEFEALPMPVGGKFNIRSHADFAGQVRSVRWIVKDILPAATLAVLFGESGSGKTFACYDLCAAVCRGVEWNGKRVTKGRVLYVVAEGVAGFVNRIKAYCHQQGISPADVDMDVISDITPNLLEPAHITDLIKDIKQRQPYDLIVMDTFAQVMPGANENSGEDVGKALAECKRIHRHTGAMVLLVHHSGKDASKGARGWSGLRAAADVELEVLRSDELRSISVTKLKDGQDGAQIGFKLHTVILGEDEDGDDITSCIVEYTNTGRATKEKGSTIGHKERQILMILNDVFGLDSGQKMELPGLIEAAAAQLAPPIDGKRDNRKRDVTRCIDSLSAKNYVFIENGEVTLGKNEDA